MSERHSRAGRLGGFAKGIIVKANAQNLRNAYYLSPNRCMQCSEVIPFPPGYFLSDIRARKFCNRSCGARFNNKSHPKREVRVLVFYCIDCKVKMSVDRKRCLSCREIFQNTLLSKTKSEVKVDILREHARRSTRAWPQICILCGYSKFVECCHRKPVKSFSLTALIREINHASNLILLCPNCHWEFDHNMVALPGFEPGQNDADYETAALPK
jgi:hypothetical protein